MTGLGATGSAAAGLSAGAVAGIAIGAIVVALSATYCGIEIYRRFNPPKAPLTAEEQRILAEVQRIREVKLKIQAEIDKLFAQISPAIQVFPRDLIRVVFDYARDPELNLDPKRHRVLDPYRTIVSQDVIDNILEYVKDKDARANPFKPKRKTFASWLQSLRQARGALTAPQPPALGLALSSYRSAPGSSTSAIRGECPSPIYTTEGRLASLKMISPYHSYPLYHLAPNLLISYQLRPEL